MSHKIKILRGKDYWKMGVISGPKMSRFIEAYGTNVIETAFPVSVEADIVVSRIQDLNPDYDVSLMRD